MYFGDSRDLHQANIPVNLFILNIDQSSVGVKLVWILSIQLDFRIQINPDMNKNLRIQLLSISVKKKLI